MCERCPDRCPASACRSAQHLKVAAGAAVSLAMVRRPLPPARGAAEAGKHRLARCRAAAADGRQHALRQRRNQTARIPQRARSAQQRQNPFAAVLSCANSRIAPEYCFDTARGDLFVCRVAGNFASDEMVASLEYAVQVLNTPLILVLGHEACGAVDATINRSRTAPRCPATCRRWSTPSGRQSRPSRTKPGDQLANAIRENVKLNVDKLKSAGPILKSFVDDNKIRVVGGIYELRDRAARAVELSERASLGRRFGRPAARSSWAR